MKSRKRLLLSNSFKLNISFVCAVFIVSMLSHAKAEELQVTDQQGMFGQIQLLATLSDVVYKDPSLIKSTSDRLGYKVSSFAQLAGARINYLLLTNNNDKSQIIVVRGTSNAENAVIDAAVKLMHDTQLDVYLHEGFAAAAKNIYQLLSPQLNRGFKVSTTGHSMGGAVALILAMYLDSDQYNVAKVVTFGQPKVTNIPGALKFKHINILRVVTPKDMIPLVPPFDPVDINNFDIYWHVGTEVILLKGNEYSMVSGVKSMMRATKFLDVQPGEENIRHHQMALYLSLISDKLDSANLIPYKNDFSFINRIFGN